MTSVTGPVAGATTTFTYDGCGRQRTATDQDGHVVTTGYDIFDRVVRTIETFFEPTSPTYFDRKPGVPPVVPGR